MEDLLDELPIQELQELVESADSLEVVEAIGELTVEFALLNETLMFFQSWLTLATVVIVIYLLYKVLWSLFK